MKIISTGAADILLVDLIDGSHPINVGHNAEGHFLWYKNGHRTYQKRIDIPQVWMYNYTILGRAKELTEEQCHEIVSSYVETEYPDYGSPYEYVVYTDGEDTAKSSFGLFLESQGILLENRYSDFECQNQWCEDGYIDEGYNYKQRCNYCQENRDLEEEAQYKVKNPLVIKANKINPGE